MTPAECKECRGESAGPSNPCERCGATSPYTTQESSLAWLLYRHEDNQRPYNPSRLSPPWHPLPAHWRLARWLVAHGVSVGESP